MDILPPFTTDIADSESCFLLISVDLEVVISATPFSVTSVSFFCVPTTKSGEAHLIFTASLLFLH
jgi:hypothetical protein